jgi:hypothetical protein
MTPSRRPVDAQQLTDTAAEHLCGVDYENEMAFAAVVGPARERADRRRKLLLPQSGDTAG